MNRALALIGGAAAGAGVAYWLIRRKPAVGPDLAGAVGTHVRQIRRYAYASSQDISPIVGITHASYALVLLDTLEEIIGKDAIVRAGYDPAKLRKFITTLQDAHAEKLKGCDAHLQQVLAVEKAEAPQEPGHVVAGAWSAPRGA